MKCPDCKGSGEYVGSWVVEPCQRCKGLGALDAEGKPDVPKNAADPASTGLPDWMEDYKDDIICADTSPITEIKPAWKPSMSPPAGGGIILTSKLQKGDIIHVYDDDWYEAQVARIYSSGSRGSPPHTLWVRADYTLGAFNTFVSNVCWNVTQLRWEYIRAGTPTYP